MGQLKTGGAMSVPQNDGYLDALYDDICFWEGLADKQRKERNLSGWDLARSKLRQMKKQYAKWIYSTKKININEKWS